MIALLILAALILLPVAAIVLLGVATTRARNGRDA